MLKVHAVPRGRSKKLSARFGGPYVIESVHRPDYVIKRGRQRKRVHGSNLKRVDGALLRDAPPRTDSTEQTVLSDPVHVDDSVDGYVPAREPSADASAVQSVGDGSAAQSDTDEREEESASAQPEMHEARDSPQFKRTRSNRVVRPVIRLDL